MLFIRSLLNFSDRGKEQLLNSKYPCKFETLLEKNTNARIRDMGSTHELEAENLSLTSIEIYCTLN